MTKTDNTVLKRHEIRAVFRKNRGAAASLARELEIAETTMSAWLKGRFDSARIAVAAQRKAVQLLQEQNTHAA